MLSLGALLLDMPTLIIMLLDALLLDMPTLIILLLNT